MNKARSSESAFRDVFAPLAHDISFRVFALCTLGGTAYVTSILIFCFHLKGLDTYQLIESLLINLVAAVIFYLIGKMPDTRQRRIAKNNLRQQYRDFRDQAATIFLGCTERSYSPSSLDDLRSTNIFRSYFKSPSPRDVRNERWHDVLNALQSNEARALTRLVTELKILRDHLNITLNTVHVSDPRVFVLASALSRQIYSLEQGESDYDDIKGLSQFLWQVFAGWSWIDGYSEEDIVERLIDDM